MMANTKLIHFESGGVKCAADLYVPDAGTYAYPRPGVVMGHGFSIIKSALVQQATYLVNAQSVEKVAEFFPDRITDLIAPRPLLIVTNAAYDVHHPLAQVQAAFDRAGEPKKLVTLPYDTVGLYSEPGLGVAMRHAIAWFDRHLLADAEAEAEALSRARLRSP